MGTDQKGDPDSQGLIKGYIAHGPQIVVLAKEKPFPWCAFVHTCQTKTDCIVGSKVRSLQAAVSKADRKSVV